MTKIGQLIAVDKEMCTCVQGRQIAKCLWAQVSVGRRKRFPKKGHFSAVTNKTQNGSSSDKDRLLMERAFLPFLPVRQLEPVASSSSVLINKMLLLYSIRREMKKPW